jgi:hypothetical protein
MSSGSLRNSSNPNVPSGRTKISTQRSTARVEGLARTDQDGSKRADTPSRIIVLPVGSATSNYPIRALLYAGKPNWRVLASIVVQ